ncbi:hypothetical protein ACFX2A_006030 [Malus domestica]
MGTAEVETISLPRGGFALSGKRPHQPHDEPLQATIFKKPSTPHHLRRHRRVARVHRIRPKTRQHPISHHTQRHTLRERSRERFCRVFGSCVDQDGSSG